MSKFATVASATAIVLSSDPVSATDLVKQVSLAPGKGVSFFLGHQQGTAIFNKKDGACGLSVFTSPASRGTMEMSGMSGSMIGTTGDTVMWLEVMPGRPARLVTPEGQQLVFSCEPDAAHLLLDMPGGFKYSEK